MTLAGEPHIDPQVGEHHTSVGAGEWPPSPLLPWTIPEMAADQNRRAQG